MSKSSRDREIARRRMATFHSRAGRTEMWATLPANPPQPPQPPRPFTMPPSYHEALTEVRRIFGVEPPPRTWRADPVKTFYVGLALGLVPFLLVMATLFIAGVLP